MLLVLEHPAIASRSVVSSSGVYSGVSQSYVTHNTEQMPEMSPPLSVPLCGAFPCCIVAEESELVPPHSTSQKGNSALARMMRPSLTRMRWGRAEQRKSGWLCRMEAVQRCWLWCCLEKAPRVPGCDILLTAACLGSGGIPMCLPAGSCSSPTTPLCCYRPFDFSVYTLSISAEGSKSKDTGSLNKHMNVVNFVVGNSIIVYISSCCPGSVF